MENRELVQSNIMINLARYDNDTVSARGLAADLVSSIETRMQRAGFMLSLAWLERVPLP